MRIAIAGFQHETNTFAPGKTGIEAFRMADSWPGLLQGDAVLSDTAGLNLPIAGAVAAAADMELVPVLWCAAEPGGPVTDEAFEHVSGMILDGLSAAGPLDGIYLDLHGAMVTESHQDGEGALLKRLRKAFGAELPIGVSLDLHANVTAAMVDSATLTTIYRTYPHLDMAATGGRCLRRLVDTIKGQTSTSAFRQVPFLVPLHAQYTGQKPCRKLYHRLDQVVQGANEWVELALGFTAADIHDCGPSVLAYARTQDRADALADDVFGAVCAAKLEFDTGLCTPREAVRRAMTAPDGGPVTIADVQDNPGAGGTADTTGLLQALIDLEAQGAVLGVVCDPDVAALAHKAGVGASISTTLGAKSGLPGQSSVEGRYSILALSDGQIAYTGEMYGGGIAEVGPSCLLRLEDTAADVQIVASTVRTQCLDQALFTHFGVDLARAKMICVKSTVHFRADFEPISSAIINTGAPGVFSCALSREQYQHLRPNVECL